MNRVALELAGRKSGQSGVLQGKAELSVLCLGFLSLQAVNSLGGITLCWGGDGAGVVSWESSVFSHIPGLYPLNASSNTPLPICDNQYFLQTIQNVS